VRCVSGLEAGREAHVGVHVVDSYLAISLTQPAWRVLRRENPLRSNGFSGDGFVGCLFANALLRISAGSSDDDAVLVVDQMQLRMSSTEPGRQLEMGPGNLYFNGRWRAVDHVAQVLETERDVDRCVERFGRLGARITEEPYYFPTDACGEVPMGEDLEKYLATIEVPGGLLVVSAPMRRADR
jgi:hypothetical protein